MSSTNPTLINGFEDVMAHIRKLEEENKKLKDFVNWENHPALKDKVVLDDDFYLEHLVDGELIEPEEFTSLLEENKKLKEENKKLKCEDDKLEDTLASLNFYTEQCAELKEEHKDLKEKLERVTKVRDDFVHTCASLNTALEIIGADPQLQQDMLKEEIDERVDDRGELDNDKLLKILYEFFNVDEDED
jgi:regulator of replication initiation timing